MTMTQFGVYYVVICQAISGIRSTEVPPPNYYIRLRAATVQLQHFHWYCIEAAWTSMLRMVSFEKRGKQNPPRYAPAASQKGSFGPRSQAS
jgi:hypothetical protein